MKVEVKRIGVLRMGVLSASFYGFMTVIMIPLMIISEVFGRPHKGGGPPWWILLMAILYPVMGFIVGIIGAALYNLIVKSVGGMQMELDVEPVQPYNSVPGPRSEAT